jgi:hypothetical protein
MSDRALFDPAIDSKLRGCDLVKIKIGTLVTGQEIRTRARVVQQKIARPVQCEIRTEVRTSLVAWLERRGGIADDYAFPSRVDHSDCFAYALAKDFGEPSLFKGDDFLETDIRSAARHATCQDEWAATWCQLGFG